MALRDEGGTRFLDGMRVTREHMEHLQTTLLRGVVGLRRSLGVGVAYGFKVEPSVSGALNISPGLAFDRQGRPLYLPDAREVSADFGDSNSAHLVALYALRTEVEVDGVPTLLFNDVEIEARSQAPPYSDDAVVFAGARRLEGTVEVFQKGEWYLPRQNHGHTGSFLFDEGDWRFDGHPLGAGLPDPPFDSTFIAIDPGQTRSLIHGLQTTTLLVQLQARDGERITSRGQGVDFWYELPSDQEIALVRSEESNGALELRALVWPVGAAPGGPQLPLADAGDDLIVESGESFVLSGDRSRAFEGMQLVTYVWTQLS